MLPLHKDSRVHPMQARKNAHDAEAFLTTYKDSTERCLDDKEEQLRAATLCSDNLSLRVTGTLCNTDLPRLEASRALHAHTSRLFGGTLSLVAHVQSWRQLSRAMRIDSHKEMQNWPEPKLK
jgi:hypothetical protein